MDVMNEGGPVLRALCAATKRPGMFACGRLPDSAREKGSGINPVAEVQRAAPWADEDQAFRLGQGETLYILFESEAEMEATFWQTVGEDGPTKTNPYAGLARVFAVTCSAAGELLHENT